MKFLIIKTSALGDIIHAFTALSYLREKCPFAQIEWVVEAPFRELVEAHPAVDRVLTIDSKMWRKKPFSRKTWQEVRQFRRSLLEYDAAFDLQGNLKSSWVLRQTYAKLKIGFGKQAVAEWPNLLFTHLRVNPPKGQNIRDDYLTVVQRYFHDQGAHTPAPVQLRLSSCELLEKIDPKATLVCAGAHWRNKQLPIKNLIAALEKLPGPFYFSWGSPSEKERAEQLAAAVGGTLLPKCSLPLLQRIMDRCAKVVAMDSLPLHLCGTTKTPTLSFFGPSSAKKYAPQGKLHQVVEGDCPFGQTFEKRCPKLRTCQSGDCINKLEFK